MRRAVVSLAICIGLSIGLSCGPPDPFTAYVYSFKPVDDTHIRIDTHFDNNSGPRARIVCQITLKESVNVVDRDEIRTRSPVGPGGAEVSGSVIRIELAPEAVRAIEVDHCAAAD